MNQNKTWRRPPQITPLHYSAPPSPESPMERPFLVETITGPEPLVILESPQGSGKATLPKLIWEEKALWAHIPEGWLEPFDLFHLLANSLRYYLKKEPNALNRLLESRRPVDPADWATALKLDWEQSQRPLIINNLHHLTDEKSLLALRLFAECLVPEQKVLFLTCEPFPFSTDALQKNNLVVHLKYQDLKLDPGESTHFFGPSISEKNAVMIYEKLDGWFAGIRLFPKALLSTKNLVGLLTKVEKKNHFVADLFLEEWMLNLPHSEVMAQIFQLRIFNGDMIGDLLGTKGLECIRLLKDEQIFMAPLPEKLGYYQIVEVYANISRKNEVPDEILFEQASEWLLRRNEKELALLYADLLSDHSLKLKILESDCEDELKKGSLVFRRHEADRNTPDELSQIPYFCANLAQALLRNSDLRLLAELREILRSGTEIDPFLIAKEKVLHSHTMIYQGMAKSASNTLHALSENPSIRSESLYSLGLSYWEQGEVIKCVETLAEGIDHQIQTGHLYWSYLSAELLVDALLLGGQRLIALDTIKRVNAKWNDKTGPINQLSLKIKWAKILWEQDETERVLELLNEASLYASFFPDSRISMETHYLKGLLCLSGPEPIRVLFHIDQLGKLIKGRYFLLKSEMKAAYTLWLELALRSLTFLKNSPELASRIGAFFKEEELEKGSLFINISQEFPLQKKWWAILKGLPLEDWDALPDPDNKKQPFQFLRAKLLGCWAFYLQGKEMEAKSQLEGLAAKIISERYFRSVQAFGEDFLRFIHKLNPMLNAHLTNNAQMNQEKFNELLPVYLSECEQTIIDHMHTSTKESHLQKETNWSMVRIESALQKIKAKFGTESKEEVVRLTQPWFPRVKE